MRAPGTGSPDWKGPKHFLTDWYTNLFQLECIPFINYCKEGFYCFYGQPKIRMEGQCIDKKFLITTSFYFKQWSSLD